jgi:L,D-transpeptidase ErfK/SrfK
VSRRPEVHSGRLHAFAGISIFLLTVILDLNASGTEIIENPVEYTVIKGDYGHIIAGKLGMDWSYIAKANSLDPEAPLSPGQVLRVGFRRIVPEKIEEGILINLPDRTLYRFEKGTLRDYYFIAAGKPTWPTPLGEFVFKGKKKEPTWYVPLSIQKEMEEEGKDVLVEVPPGPDNPLGTYWLQLSIGGIGLHGTNTPQSIYKFRSHGCMRLRPEVAEFLFHSIPVGTKGRIIYRPVKVFRTPEGRILVEIYKDFYKRGVNYQEEIRQRLKELNALNDVDWDKVQDAVGRKDGIVKDVSR